MELNGLRNIIGATGALGGIESPPEPEDFRTDAEYCAALDAYYDRVSPFWKVSQTAGRGPTPST
jgi:hypothetical protein